MRICRWVGVCVFAACAISVVPMGGVVPAQAAPPVSQPSGATGDQAELYSRKQWVDPPFCDGELAAAPAESVTTLGPGGVESVQP